VAGSSIGAQSSPTIVSCVTSCFEAPAALATIGAG
jgi:hypothetical protein